MTPDFTLIWPLNCLKDGVHLYLLPSYPGVRVVEVTIGPLLRPHGSAAGVRLPQGVACRFANNRTCVAGRLTATVMEPCRSSGSHSHTTRYRFLTSS